MFRFQYSVTTKAGKELAWKTFTDHRRWNQFVNAYGDIRWAEGRPWEPGSRLEIEIRKPVTTTISHVITSCQPARRIGWIDHALGVVIAQWVDFQEIPGVGTRIQTWGDVVHSGVLIAGRTAEQVITGFTESWYENFRGFCDGLGEAAGD